MRLFRRSLDLSLATPREGTPEDLTAVSRLIRNSAHRFTSFPNPNLPSLLTGAPSMLLTAGTEIWATAIAGWPTDSTAWLRTMAIADGLMIGPALDLLLPPFHELLRARRIQQLFYAGDEAADIWIQPALSLRGYERETDVVVYEKPNLDVPSHGNQEVRVRQAEAVDLPMILEIDRTCFAPQWNKDESIIGPALFEVPYFVVVELAGEIIGYSFATTHFEGRLVHLVRIAVLPSYQGQAIGVRLLAELVDFAQASGANVLTLNTQAHNTVAQRLYEWFGFQRTGEKQTVLRYDL
jgi:ribosomal protein S18 acetylase RimI-like enzyme